MSDHDFTYEEAEEAIQAANEQLARNANPLRSLLVRHPFKIFITITVLTAFIMYQFILGLTTISSPFVAVGIQHTVPHTTADFTSEYLGELQDSAQLLDKHCELAEKVRLNAQDVYRLTNNATLQNALETLTFTPNVLRKAAKGINKAAKAGKTTRDMLQEMASLVEEAAKRVPVEAEAALTYFQQTLHKLKLRLGMVLGLFNDTIVVEVKEHDDKLEKLNELLVMVAESPEKQSSGSFISRHTSSLWQAIFGHGNQLDDEGPPPMQELSEKLTRGPARTLSSAIPFLGNYTELLQSLESELQEDAIGDTHWTSRAELEALASSAGGAGNVAPAVARNLEILVGMVDMVQLQFE